MIRFEEKRRAAEKYSSIICPQILRKIRMRCKEASMIQVFYAGYNHYEMREESRTYTLVLDKRICDYKVWDKSGISCVYAIATIQVEHGEIKKYVHGYYNKEAWAGAYAGIIYPISDSRL